MPLYDYQCTQCKKVTEVRHGFKDVHSEPCPHCGGSLSRVFNPAGIVFKGSGFYITDSRKPGANAESGAPATASAVAPAAGTPAASASTATPAAAAPKKSDAA